MRFSDQLSMILEEQTTQCGSLLDTATDIANHIEATKQQLSELKRKLSTINRKINTNLATVIRRENPSLNISVTAEGCKIGYKTKTLIFDPDIFKGIWSVESNDPKFSSRFKRRYRKCTVLDPSITDLSSAIMDYFTVFYKSLNESIIGNGVTLIDGKNVSLRELVEHCEKSEWLINA